MTSYGKLILISADGTEQLFPLTAAQITLGRDETRDIVLADRKASRLHARLECNEQGCVLIDAGSANKTFVDGQPVQRITLRSGNLIKIGTSTLRFEQESPSSQPGRARPARRGRVSTDHKLLSQFLDDLERGTAAPDASTEAVPLRDRLLRSPRLVIYTPQKTWEIRLKDQESWTIGRTSPNDILIDHQKVSRHHARIERQADGFIIRDLASTNGTRLGQQPIQAHTLRHADTLNIGHAQLIFQDTHQMDQDAEELAQKTERRPVVVVPGQFGSVLWRGQDKIWPSVGTIVTHPEKFKISPNNLVEARGIVDEVVVVPGLVEIESYSRIHNYLDDTLQYTLGKDLLEFAYDWRDDIRLAAQKLAQTIEAWPTSGPVVIVAHSLGCLVSRYYVDRLGGHRKVKKLLLMGDPVYGTLNALLSVFPDNLNKLESFISSISGSLLENIRRTFASFPVQYQMLPTYPAIFDQDGQPIDLYEDRSWLPQKQQALLQTSYETRRELNGQATIPTTCIFGYGVKTLTRLNIERDQQGRWHNVELINTADGDGQVATRSAVLPGAEIHPVQRSHNQLYVDEDVLMRLKYELIG